MFETLFTRYPFFRYIPAILGMALIFRMSATPGTDLGSWVAPMDKVLHGLAYMFLALAFSLWAKPNLWEKKIWKAFLIGCFLPVLYGASDEFHQTFVPGRDGGLPDFLADSVGALIGFLVYFFIMKFCILAKKSKVTSQNIQGDS